MVDRIEVDLTHVAAFAETLKVAAQAYSRHLSAAHLQIKTGSQEDHFSSFHTTHST